MQIVMIHLSNGVLATKQTQLKLFISTEKLMKDPEQRSGFLDFCHRYDSNPFVCGMGKDNLLAQGEL